MIVYHGSNVTVDSPDVTLDRLRFERPTNQYCFRTQAAIDLCLSFEGSVVL